MKTSILSMFILIVFAAGFSASAQESRSPVSIESDIHIKQLKSEDIELPGNDAELNEILAMEENEIRAIAIYYPEQKVLLKNSFSTTNQWDPDSTGFSLQGDPGPGVDSVATSEGQLAELLRKAMTRGREDPEDESNPKSEEVEAFRKAFEAVLREENSDEDSDRKPVLYEDVDGMVLDETRSKTGRDFYNAFYAAWSKPEGASNYIIRISEKPGPGMGHIVFIEIDYDEVFELRLRPGDHRMRQAGNAAVARARDFLNERPETTSIY